MYRQINFYRQRDGRCPVRVFLDSLSGKEAQKVVWVLQLIEDLERIPGNYFKKLAGTEDIWECRIQLGTNDYRILGFFIENSELVLTHGFIKKSQKTPLREIEKAQEYRKDFLKRRLK